MTSCWLFYRRLYDANPRVQLASPVGSHLHCTFFISHGDGTYWNLFLAVTADTVTVFGPPQHAPEDSRAPKTAKDVLRYDHIDAVGYVSVIVWAVVNDAEGLELLRKRAKTISFGVAPLDDATAPRLIENGGPQLRHCYGTVETQMQPVMKLEGHGLPYLTFHSVVAGIQMVPVSGSGGLHKFIIRRDDKLK